MGTVYGDQVTFTPMQMVYGGQMSFTPVSETPTIFGAQMMFVPMEAGNEVSFTTLAEGGELPVSGVNRSISIYIDSTFGEENTIFLDERVRRVCRSVGELEELGGATVDAGTRQDNVTFQIASGGTNTRSISILVSELMPEDKWTKLVELILRIVRTSEATFTMETNDEYVDGDRADTCRFIIMP